MYETIKVSNCQNRFTSLSTDQISSTRYIAFPLRCHSWDCPICRKIKAKKYVKRIKANFTSNQLYFYTFTYYHNSTPYQAWKTYNAAWNRLRTYLSKTVGEFKYARVLESHNESPYPHLHVIASRSFPTGTLFRALRNSGFGYQTKSQRITGQGAIYYLAKYLTKEWRNKEAWNLRKQCNCRLISFSSGVFNPSTTGGNWRYIGNGPNLASCIENIEFAISANKHGTVTTTYENEELIFYEVVVLT